MNRRSCLCFKAGGLVFALMAGSTAALAAPTSHLTAGAAARSAPSTQTLPAALRPVLYQTLAKDAESAYALDRQGCATLSQQKFTACFGNDGARFSGAGSLGLHLLAFGRGKALTSIQAVPPVIVANQVTYDHGNLSEWWRVLPVGFEQGFTIAKKPAGNGELVLALAASRPETGTPIVRRPGEGRDTKSGLDTGLRRYDDGVAAAAGMTKEENTVAWGKLRYGQLVVTDAKGRVIPATLSIVQDREQARSHIAGDKTDCGQACAYAGGERILIAVNDSHAVYPLTVDPLLWVEQKVTASDGAEDDEFGFAATISGNTALVGAYDATVNGNSTQGAAYVFSELNGTWTQTAKLTASDGAAGDGFGGSVALNGTTALVGANQFFNDGAGAVYVFSELNGSWTQTQKLTIGDGAAGDEFGNSVALADTTAVITAPSADVNGTHDQGAAYVFELSNGSWAQTQKLTANDGAANDDFGSSVALAGTTAFISAIFATVNGNPAQGAVYVFDEADGTWTQMQKFSASDGAAGDLFGLALALNGTTAFVGDPFKTINGNTEQGAVYVFGESDGTWTQTEVLTESDGEEGDFFGAALALAGTDALIGAYGVNVNGHGGQGRVYVYSESGGSWMQTQTLTASDGAANDNFGQSVFLAGTTAQVGAPGAAVDGNSYQGAVYFYGQSDLDLSTSAPQTVNQGQQYTSQTIVTNNASAASPAVSATMSVPAAASFISATADQGSCSEASGLVTCDFGQIPGNAGTATANVTLKAIGSPGTTIENSASIAKATPPLTASAATTITEASGCPAGYVEYDGALNARQLLQIVTYQAAAGEENAILSAPPGSQLYVRFVTGGRQKILRIPGNEIHRRAPAGTYTWAAKAGNTGGNYTFCLMHP